MSGVTQARLDGIYAHSTDPWQFRTSAYEKAKYEATLKALVQPAYTAILELGCGNGELAARLATRTSNYVGVDAACVAITEARRLRPDLHFVELYLPAHLPEGPFDLIVASEILYFLDLDGIADLANQMIARWPQAEILAVNYLGPSGNDLQGLEALTAFSAALSPAFEASNVKLADHYRIDRYLPRGPRKERLS